ncbi:MAG: hypothetical protein HYR60_12815 [Acidobacteria bacterium]|nr:hypothetical protein [Acidobacteriota bacterium]MBI3473403.1 hypothetical protein [Candidatus Solibacter usitatus]
MVADLVGDYRDEVVCTTPGAVYVYTNIEPAGRREVTRTASREYRLWMARNMGGGYPSYFEWEAAESSGSSSASQTPSKSAK